MLDMVSEQAIRTAIDSSMGACFNNVKGFSCTVRDGYAAAAGGKITKAQLESDIAVALRKRNHGVSEHGHLLNGLVTSWSS